jgi:lipopolysaccharide export system protein LptA
MKSLLSRLAQSAALVVALNCLPPIGAALAPGALAQTAAPAPQAGTTFLPGASSREPINVAADKLDYFDKQQKAVYTGNVVAVQGDTRLNASSLTIYFDRKSDAKPAAKPAAGPGSANSQLRRMEGAGPIAVTNKDQVGTGDSLVYDKPENKFYLIGNVALSQGENVTRGDKLIYDLTTGQAVVSSKGRVHSLIVPNDQQNKPAPAPAKPAGKPAH